MVHVEVERRAREREKGKKEKKKRRAEKSQSGLYPETKLDARRDPGRVVVAVVMVRERRRGTSVKDESCEMCVSTSALHFGSGN